MPFRRSPRRWRSDASWMKATSSTMKTPVPGSRRVLDRPFRADRADRCGRRRSMRCKTCNPMDSRCGEFDRSARVQRADEYLRRCRRRSRADGCDRVSRQSPGAGPSPSRVTAPGTRRKSSLRCRRASSNADDGSLALPFEHAIHRAVRVPQDIRCGELRAIPPADGAGSNRVERP